MFTKTFSGCGAGFLWIVSWGLTPPAAIAQSAATDVGEIAMLGGMGFAGGVKPMLAGSSGIAFSRYAIGMFDTTFLALGQNTIQSWPARSTVEKSYLFDFGADFHIRIPVKDRWAPYAIAGGGLLWNRVRARIPAPQGGSFVVNHYEQFNGALHTGGGLRYYAGESWGIRSEVKVIVSKQVYTLVSMGIFYVTPTNWP